MFHLRCRSFLEEIDFEPREFRGERHTDVEELAKLTGLELAKGRRGGRCMTGPLLRDSV